MFIGHFAVALAVKRAVPRTSLGVLFAAAQLPDVVWPALVLAGAEKVEIRPGDTAFTPLHFAAYPWSHSLLMVALTGAAAGGIYTWTTKYRAGGFAIAGLALSHWVLDWISHRPDLPLYPGRSPLVGLALWNSIAATMLVEGGMFAAGAALYAGGTVARDRAGRYGFWLLISFLAAVYCANAAGSPPPGVGAIAAVGLAGAAVLLAWAAWADRHRVPRSPASA